MFAYNVYLNNSKHFRALTDSLKSMVDECVFKNLVSYSEKISLRLFLLVSKIAHVSGISTTCTNRDDRCSSFAILI